MDKLIAQSVINVGNTLQGEGILANFGVINHATSPFYAPDAFNRVLSVIIAIVTIIATIWFFFILITSAVSIISSGSDKAVLETAKKRIYLGFAGLLIVIASIMIVDIIGTLLGLDILDPAEWIYFRVWNVF